MADYKNQRKFRIFAPQIVVRNKKKKMEEEKMEKEGRMAKVRKNWVLHFFPYKINVLVLLPFYHRI
jgi:hypothetical protein